MSERRQHYLNLYYVVLGLITGVIGNLWVYHFSKYLENHFPALNWDIVFYLSSIAFLLWLVLWIRWILRGLKRDTTLKEERGENREKENPKVDKDEEQRSKYIDSPLLTEYKMAQEMHNYYGKISWEIASILIAGSLALVGLSLQSSLITKERFLCVAVAVTITMSTLYFLFRRIAQLVEIHVVRLNQIEGILHFHQHRYVHKAHERGYVIIEDKCHKLSSPRASNSVKFLILFLTLSVWLIAISLFVLQ